MQLFDALSYGRLGTFRDIVKTCSKKIPTISLFAFHWVIELKFLTIKCIQLHTRSQMYRS